MKSMRSRSRRNLLLPVAVVASASLLYTCRPDDELERLKKPRWSPELAVPLVHARLSIEDVLTNSDPGNYVTVDDEDRITLVYEDVIETRYARDYFPLLDRLLKVVNAQTDHPFDVMDHATLTYLQLADGILDFELLVPGRSGISSATIRIENLERGGKTFEIHLDSNDALRGTADLSEAAFNFAPPYEHNTLKVFLEVIDRFGNDVTSTSTLFLRFRDLVFRNARGWFDRFALDLSRDTLTLDVFNYWKEGVVYVEAPRARLRFLSSVGVPLNASLSVFEAGDYEPGSTIVPIDFSSALGDTFTLAFPSLENVEGFVNSTYTLDKENSNIQNVIAISPKQLHYGLAIVADHKVGTDQQGFINDTSKVQLDLAVELPLTLRIDGALVTDTFAVEADLADDLRNLERAILEVRTENGLPISLGMQLYLLDQQRNVIDSLLTNSQLIVDGTIGPEGKVVKPGRWQNSIVLSREQVDKLEYTRFIALVGRVETIDSGNQSVSFFRSNYFGIDLALRLKYRLN